MYLAERHFHDVLIMKLEISLHYVHFAKHFGLSQKKAKSWAKIISLVGFQMEQILTKFILGK